MKKRTILTALATGAAIAVSFISCNETEGNDDPSTEDLQAECQATCEAIWGDELADERAATLYNWTILSDSNQ